MAATFLAWVVLKWEWREKSLQLTLFLFIYVENIFNDDILDIDNILNWMQQ